MLKSAVPVVVALLLSSVASASPPTWSSKYTVSGLLTIPFAEIEEPFAAFVDMGAGKSRLDFYGGMDRVFQRGDLNAAFKVVPFTDEEAENKVGCFAVNGTKESPVEPQSVLPDLTGFTLRGEEEEEEEGGGRNNIYLLFSTTTTLLRTT